MLLSTSPPASAFMPMSSSPDAAMLYHHNHNFSDDEGCPSSDNLNDLYTTRSSGNGGRMMRTYPTFPPMSSSAKPKIVRPNNGSTAGSATVSVVHRRTTTYNLSLQDFRQLTNKLLVDNNTNTNGTCRPKKPACRTLTTSATFPGSDLSAEEKASAVKKRVVFADDRGFQLTEIRIMTEPSDVPPKIRSSVFRALLGDAYCDQYDFVSSDASSSSSCWTLTFKQPASDYVAFRRRLDDQNVGLENVLLKNGKSPRLVGTVKVKNLSFEKNVFVRFTSDKWTTSVDHQCIFTPHIGAVQDGTVYDTFQFEFDIPTDSEKRQTLEMCVCYRTGDGREFWDNNNGQNFKIASSKFLTEDKNNNNNNTNNNNKNDQKFNNNGKNNFTPYQQCQLSTDAFTLDFTNWAQFASWNHLTTDGPYW